MEYANLKGRVAAVIKENGNMEITGDQLQGVLFDMVGNLGSGYQFGGIVTPLSNPGRPDAKMLYLAFEEGEYEHLGGLTLNKGMGIFTFDSAWHLEVIEYTEREYIERAFEERVNKTTAQAEVDLKADELTPVMPPMVTGSARGVLGRSAAARFLHRQTSSGSGAAWLRSIRGRIVSYNQLVQNGDFSDGTTGWSGVGGVITVANNVGIFTAGASVVDTSRIQRSISTVAGHKYRVRVVFQSSVNGQLRIKFNNSPQILLDYSAGVKTTVKGIITEGNTASTLLYLYPNNTGTMVQGDTCNFYTVEVTDLTQAGLDTLITTPEQFEAWQMEQFGHNDYIAYTPGKLVNVNPTGIKTTTPGGDEHTLPLDFTEHFATGMNGLNGIYDEVVSDENGKFTDGEKRFGIVDLGTLTWTKLANKNVFRASLSDAKPAANNYAKANVICPNYYTDATGFVEANIDGIGINTGKLITVGDDRYTNPADFKTAMSGVPLVFELATPQHVTFTDPSDAVYPVAEGGTEQVLPVNGKVPTTISPDMTLQMPRILGKETPTMGTLDNFLAAIGPKIGKTITKEWDPETHSYQFEIQ